MAFFHLTIIRPNGYLHSDCFFEVAEGLRYALTELGHEVTFAENQIQVHVTTIVLGAHLLSEAQAAALPASVIVYNLEQLGHSYTPPWYPGLATHVQIWDYAPAHLPIWRSVPSRVPPQLVEIGFVPQLCRIHPASNQDVDVLFYGSSTKRRQSIVDKLRASGMRVETIFGIYGASRDALIARSKLVLNLHAADNQIFEIVRVSYLLTNRKAVVSEISEDMGEMADAVACCTYEEIVSACLRLLERGDERHALEQRGFNLFSAHRQADVLSRVVGTAAGN